MQSIEPSFYILSISINYYVTSPILLMWQGIYEEREESVSSYVRVSSPRNSYRIYNYLVPNLDIRVMRLALELFCPPRRLSQGDTVGAHARPPPTHFPGLTVARASRQKSVRRQGRRRRGSLASLVPFPPPSPPQPRS
jgi:hypothetical protein